MTSAKRHFLALSLLHLAVGLMVQAGCATDSDSSGSAGGGGQQGDRKPIGKADALSGSCASNGTNHCGGPSTETSWCDEACQGFGDCCGDYKAACTQPSCVDPSDEAVHYVNDSYLNPVACTTVFFTCDGGQTLFSNECGCGCLDDPNAECPSELDPTVHYVFESQGHPENCYAAQQGGKKLLFKCDPGQTPFQNDCGCGCVENEQPICPDPQDPKVHYVANSNEDPAACLVTFFTCARDQELFSSECGCGCIDGASACPDPANPKVHYVNESHGNPAACLNVLFQCSADQALFFNDCGCGCIDS